MEIVMLYRRSVRPSVPSSSFVSSSPFSVSPSRRVVVLCPSAPSSVTSAVSSSPSVRSSIVLSQSLICPFVRLCPSVRRRCRVKRTNVAYTNMVAYLREPTLCMPICIYVYMYYRKPCSRHLYVHPFRLSYPRSLWRPCSLASSAHRPNNIPND